MRFTYRAAGPIAAVFLMALLTACSRTQHDWRVAQQAGTAQAYKVFATRHPESELAGVARQRAAQLTEEAVWQHATRANTAAAYQEYLAQYPHGAWSQDARIRMESQSLAGQDAAGGGAAVTPPGWPSAKAPAQQAAPATASRSGPYAAADREERSAATTAPAARAGLARAPATRGMAAAGQAPSGPEAHVRGHDQRFAVQLGAFSSAANARTAWARLSTRFRRELRGLTPRVVPVSVSGRRLYRLETAVADRSAARQLCRQLKQHSQGCLPAP